MNHTSNSVALSVFVVLAVIAVGMYILMTGMGVTPSLPSLTSQCYEALNAAGQVVSVTCY